VVDGLGPHEKGYDRAVAAHREHEQIENPLVKAGLLRA
jgi:hypothetical protein